MFWKLLTHDYRPPLQGGEPIWDGKALPFSLPRVHCDSSSVECGAGWNFVRTIEDGFRIAGLWRDGRPATVLAVEPDGKYFERGNKLRCASLSLVRRATDDEVYSAIGEFSKVFGAHAEAMALEQRLWWQALGRPLLDPGAVVIGLQAALDARGLQWRLKEFSSETAAWDAWDAWAARDAWDARDARDARAAWAAWDARAAWAAWDARDARDARAAWAALTVQFAARSGWIALAHDKLTVGIRDAYRNGLAVAIPTGKDELGWAMGSAKEQAESEAA